MEGLGNKSRKQVQHDITQQELLGDMCSEQYMGAACVLTHGT